jgi:excisionase family DNA binding protein
MSNKRKRKEFFTSKELAALLSCSEITLRNQRHKGEGIKFYKIGRLVRYRRKDVVDYLRKNIHKPLKDSSR